MYERTAKSYDQILEDKGFSAEEIYSLDLAHRTIYAKLRSRITSFASGDVLDIGAGRDLLRKVAGDSVKRWISLDFDTRATTIDVQGDAHSLPFDEASFDCIVCADVLEHLYDPEKALEEMRRVLRARGILIISVPFFLNLHEEPYDFSRYSIYGLRAVLRRHGFGEIEIERTCGLPATFGYWLVAGITKSLNFSRTILRIALILNLIFQKTVLAWLDSRIDKRGKFSQGHIGVFRKV
jgi:ubiquinone/menaquinone biosynthesis C-methylase UbiE